MTIPDSDEIDASSVWGSLHQIDSVVASTSIFDRFRRSTYMEPDIVKNARAMLMQKKRNNEDDGLERRIRSVEEKIDRMATLVADNKKCLTQSIQCVEQTFGQIVNIVEVSKHY